MEGAVSLLLNQFGFLSSLKNLVTSPKNLALLVISLWVGGKISGKDVLRFTKANKTIVFLPLMVYDITARLAWFVNYLINQAPRFQPNSLNWDEDESLSPEKIANAPDALSSEQLMDLKAKILDKKKQHVLKEREIIQLFDTLPPATTEDMVGHAFNGRIVLSHQFLDVAQHLLVTPLTQLGLAWGKRYCTRQVGDPLLVRWKDKFYFPLPLWGNVSIQEMNYRGKIQATMRYDHQPWNDYFRILDNTDGKLVILGVWVAREKNGGWFTLTHDPSVEV